jgi:protein-tyrosine sulfotransferase
VLASAYSSVGRLQDALAAGNDLACTNGTGVVPLCEIAAETWRRIEGGSGQVTSRLAVSTIRGLVTAQVTAILAAAGKSRWCELATAEPQSAATFLRIFPAARFVCVHRESAGVISAVARSSPWGRYGPGLVPYLQAYPGNLVAAVAAHWAHSTEQLLAFERAHASVVHRVRYEDVCDDAGESLMHLRSELGLRPGAPGTAAWDETDTSGAAAGQDPSPVVPMDMIPGPLLRRIAQAHAELGYPPPIAGAAEEPAAAHGTAGSFQAGESTR